MREIDVRKTQFTVSDFLSWQREGSLNINPPFQRRSVWKPGAKSYFMDSVVRGLPAPIIYLRQRVHLETQKAVREVVDGQQRLRTLFAYINPKLLSDYNEAKDGFAVKPTHSKELAGKSFKQIAEKYQQRILEYEFSTHILPISIEDRDVLEIFARLNATGVKLNEQELRNAEYFGELKTTLYELAHEQLDRWRTWKIFTDDQISRMKEVEVTSDLVHNMVKGLQGKNQRVLNSFYKANDDRFPDREEVARRFRQIMDEIEVLLGQDIRNTAYRGEVLFFSLFTYLYDELYGLGSSLGKRKTSSLPGDLHRKLIKVSNDVRNEKVPADVLDAIRRAPVHPGRRKTRLSYMHKVLDA